MNLLICGNGFDMNHKLTTSYSDYREYLRKNHSKIMDSFEKFPWFNIEDKNNLWTNIEDSLLLNYRRMFSQLIACFNDYQNGDKNAIIDLENDLEDITRFIYQFTGDCFYLWLLSISIDNIEAKQEIADIIKNSIVVNFNYTETIEKVYGLEEKRIFHIHGKLSKVNNENCLSNHVLPSFRTIEESEAFSEPIIEWDKWNSDIIRNEIQFGSPTILANTIEVENFLKTCDNDKINENIRSLIDKTVKYLPKNIEKLKEFISHTNISNIYIMGLNLNGTDDYYFKEVFIPEFKKCKWIFYYHGDYDLQEKKDFAKKYSLENIEYKKW